MKKSFHIRTILAIMAICLCSYGCTSPVSTTPDETQTTETEEIKNSDELQIVDRFVDDIPVTEFFVDDGTKKPVVLAAHSYSTHKQQFYDFAKQLANDGFYVITFDAYGHGQRNGGELKSFPEIMAMYPQDMEKVLSTLKNNPQADLNRLGMTGISMGACAIYKYATVAEIKPKAIAPIVGTPFYEQFVSSQLSVTTYDSQMGMGISTFPQSELNNILADSSPYKDRDKLINIAMLLQQGQLDHVVSPDGAEMLYQDLKDKGAENIELIVHEKGGHNVEQFHLDLVYDFFKNKL